MEYRNGILTITEKCDKVRISHGGFSYSHDIGAENILPLSFGDGAYTVELLKRIIGNRYKRLSTQTIRASGTDEYMQRPNSYVPVTDAWAFAVEMCAGMDALRAYKAVCDWVRNHILYDYIKAIMTPKNKAVMPDPALCWDNRLGICTDIASLTVGMLRAVGVPSRMAVGKADRQNHAWVEAVIDGKVYRFDHPRRAASYKGERRY